MNLKKKNIAQQKRISKCGIVNGISQGEIFPDEIRLLRELPIQEMESGISGAIAATRRKEPEVAGKFIASGLPVVLCPFRKMGKAWN